MRSLPNQNDSTDPLLFHPKIIMPHPDDHRVPLARPTRSEQSKARRNGRAEPVLLRLARAAVRFANVIEAPESIGLHPLSDEYTEAFMAADEESREAMLAYARSLPPKVRALVAAHPIDGEIT